MADEYLFKILDYKRHNSNHLFIVQGSAGANKEWDFSKILPYMTKVTVPGSDYEISANPWMGDYQIVDKRTLEEVASRGFTSKQVTGNSHIAIMRLDDTIIAGIKKLHVFDRGIGKQMIEKYVRSIETQLKTETQLETQ